MNNNPGHPYTQDLVWMSDSESDNYYYYCDSLEFDAPKFINFDKTPYRRRLIAIEAILHDNTMYIPDSEMTADEDTEDIDWFGRTHYSHEATNPPSPPIPLITPTLSKRIGLGSPGRIVKTSSSEPRRSPLYSAIPFNNHKSPFSPLRTQTILDLDDDSMLNRTPSPPRLVHDLTLIDAYTNCNSYNRRESGEDLSDLTLSVQDELVGMSQRPTINKSAVGNKITLRPQRILSEDISPNVRKVVSSRLCPPPTSIKKPERAGINTSYRLPGKPVQVDDIKRLLLEHNQRVKRK